MLLPPFVPPSARVSSPLVSQRPVPQGEHTPVAPPPAYVAPEASNTFEVLNTIEYSVALPSIEQYVLRTPYVGKPVIEAFADVNPAARIVNEPPIVLEDGRELVQLGGGIGRRSEPEGEGMQAADETKEGGAPSDEGAVSVADVEVVPVVAEGSELTADEGSVSAAVGEGTAVLAEGDTSPVVKEDTAALAPQATTEAITTREEVSDWVAAERDSFDWNAVAQLAAQARDLTEDEAERAEAEWLSTDWDAIDKSSNEQVARLLMKLAKRIKSGQLEVDVQKQTTTEAALLSVLSALLNKNEPQK